MDEVFIAEPSNPINFLLWNQYNGPVHSEPSITTSRDKIPLYLPVHLSAYPSAPIHTSRMRRVNGYDQIPPLQALEFQNYGGPVPGVFWRFMENFINAQKRVRYIAVALTEQHANVNVTVNWNGDLVSAIHFTCDIADCDLVALLLKHGTNPEPALPCASLDVFLPTPAAKQHFADLKAQGTNPGRPPPASRHIFHLNVTPRSSRCQIISPVKAARKKTYEKCCKQGNFGWVERWDADKQRILSSLERSHHINADQRPFVEEVFKHAAADGFNINVEALMPGVSALTRVIPSGRGRTMPKSKCLQAQEVITEDYILIWNSYETRQSWNTAIDEYVQNGTDPRPRLEIKKAAKISVSLRPLYASCEADGCQKMAGVDIEKLSRCSRCKYRSLQYNCDVEKEFTLELPHKSAKRARPKQRCGFPNFDFSSRWTIPHVGPPRCADTRRVLLRLSTGPHYANIANLGNFTPAHSNAAQMTLRFLEQGIRTRDSYEGERHAYSGALACIV
ncbi:hypothetical protein C8J57DRAFT_1459819 [Mycena rebaudengoi]|nr:hypothetical protein C8J57DRAFT_1459819 [Mycena rebaudengoi]